ncbi:MAG: hypothetical protein CMJ18_07580 [Phycisphaeraceae bacterium]|nr:hypothetical protein [Phycisphaeraceae bacterium]
MNQLKTEEDLAEILNLDGGAKRVAQLRAQQKWPHVRLGRFEVRFTDDQIAEIIRSRSEAGVKAPTKSTGLTSRSARKAS